MTTEQEHAASYCDMIRPDRTCAIMEALKSEASPLCKLFREPAADCRYLRHVILKPKTGRRRHGHRNCNKAV